MEALVNYNSDDEPEEIMDHKTAQRGNRGPSPGKSRHSYGNESTMRNHGSSVGRRDTPNARNNNFRDESPPRPKASSYSEFLAKYHSRDRDSGDNRDSREKSRDRRDNRRESRDNRRSDSRDDRERDRERDKRYSNKDPSRNDFKNDRTRSRDNKIDYNRDRDNNNDNSRRPPPPRDDDRQRRPSSPSSYKSNRSSGNGREERPRYDSSSSNATTSSTFRPPHHHNRSYDQRHSDRDRSERRSTDRANSRNRRRSNSHSPSPPPHPNQRHSHSHKRSSHTDKSHSRHRTRSRSRSITPKRRSVSRERGDRESHPLEQARKSAIEMERKIQTVDEHVMQNDESQTYNSGTSSQSGFRSHTQPLLSLPLSETAPKQPNVIAVAPASTSSAEPAVIQLPSYYNPNVINPNRYAEQVQKRKLIWGAKKTEDTAKKWGNAQFSQDTDGKVASKFMRLMGIKSGVPPSKGEGAEVEQKPIPSVAPDVKTREVMFSNMEQQYEVARQVTHTMRGVGLGFSSQARPF